MRRLLYICVIAFAVSCADKTDVLVVGGGASGISAALQAARMGTDVVVVEETPWLGGMLTSAGVSAVDGNYKMRGGIFGEFVDSLASRYGGLAALQTGWVSNVNFEPHVGAEIFANMAAREESLHVLEETSFVSASRISNGGWKVVLQTSQGRLCLKTRVLVDATELGDVSASVGVPYRLGFDSREETGESIAPQEKMNVVQDLTVVAVLQDYGYGQDMTIDMPKDYNPGLYRNSALGKNNVNVTYFDKDGREVWALDPEGKAVKNDTRQSVYPAWWMIRYGMLPVGKSGVQKYMINWPGEGNDFYTNMVEYGPEQRRVAMDSAVNVTLGFVYYLQTELGMKNLGLAYDEFPGGTGIAMIPYHRESRRIFGKVTFTMDDAAEPFRNNLYRTSVAVGDYPVDHHHFRNPRWAELPNLEFYPIPSFTVPLGVMVPQDERYKNLIVAEKSISVSNLINGTTRLQPVVMELGQAAGVLAALAVKNGVPVSGVGVREVQDELLYSGCYLMPYVDVPVDDPAFAAVQRIGATGILRGRGESIGWSNITSFRPDDPLVENEIFLDDYIRSLDMKDADVLVALTAESIAANMTRKEFAVRLDDKLSLFARAVDIEGNIL